MNQAGELPITLKEETSKIITATMKPTDWIETSTQPCNSTPTLLNKLPIGLVNNTEDSEANPNPLYGVTFFKDTL